MKQILTHGPQLQQILATRRREAGLTQSALATKLAISQNRLSEIEAAPEKLTVERLLELCNLLRLDVVIQDRVATRSTTKAEW